MVIDAHNHPNRYEFAGEKITADMDKLGIDKLWLLSCETPKGEYHPSEVQASLLNGGSDLYAIPFELCIPYAERYPDRFILGFAPDPRTCDAVERLKSAVLNYGVKVCGEMKFRMMADNPDAVAVYRAAGELGLPVVMHMQLPSREYPKPDYWYNGGIDALERALQLAPETKFIGHAPAFWSEISKNSPTAPRENYPSGPVQAGGNVIRLLEKYDNLYCDISASSGLNALKRDPNFAKRFLTDYQERILYARDCYNMDHKGFIESLALAPEVMRKIMGENAARLVGEL